MRASKDTRVYGRETLWKRTGKDLRSISLICNHLGGDTETKWVLEWDKGLREDTTGKFETVELRGRDMYRTPNLNDYYVLTIT